MSEPTSSPRFLAALAAFDAANSADPNRELADGREEPRELLYARRVTAWVLRLRPGASEALQLAARCQHLCRWEIPRTRYPADRPGYLRWRRDLQQFHARKAAEILARVGYDAPMIARVQALNLKRNLGQDAELQVLEDALCLVFLQYQLAELATRTDDEKLVNALRKSWGKMSEAGRTAALALEYGERERRLLETALNTP
jgi:hypothetical protein